MEEVDVAVVGAGIVGLACAARLARSRESVLVLESHPRYGMETSSRNSEVVHAGIYYPVGSLKSRLCHRGRGLLYSLAAEAGFFAKKTGKLIAATDDQERTALEKLADNARNAGAEGLALIDGKEATRRAPGLKAVAALWSPESGIVEADGFLEHLYHRSLDAGVIFLFNSPLSSVEKRDGGYALTFGAAAEKVLARKVINAAGLYCDRVAALAGIDPDKAGYRLHWCKGSYFRVRKEISLAHLIYPMPAKHGLGVHITIDRAGRIRLGPDTEFVDRIDYAVDAGKAKAFHAAVSRYFEGISLEDVVPDTSGIRPKLTGPEGGFRDFVVAEEGSKGLPGWVNLIGIESPGLTASLAIAERVEELIE